MQRRILMRRHKVSMHHNEEKSFIGAELTICAVDGYFVHIAKALTMLILLLYTSLKNEKIFITRE